MKQFAEVKDAELALIKDQLGKEAGDKKSADNLTGLAFSGGGIRSATFNLGIIQSLAGSKLLEKFDYLSTVSGGGYIGSWMSAQIRRQDISAEKPGGLQKVRAFQQALNTARETGVEHAAVKWLRSYSNYLTPEKGVSGDTLAALGTWLRNTLLNQATLFFFFASLLMLPQVVALLSAHEMTWITPRLFWLLLGLLLSACAIFLCILQLPKLRCCNDRQCPGFSRHRSSKWTLLIIPLGILAAYSLGMWLYWTSLMPNIWEKEGELNQLLNAELFGQVVSELGLIDTGGQISSPLLTAIEAYWSPLFISILWAFIYTVPWLAAALYTLLRPPAKRCTTIARHREEVGLHANGEPLFVAEKDAARPLHFAVVAVLSALIAGALGGLLIYLLSHLVAGKSADMRLWWATGFGTPLMLVIFSLILVLHQGLMARLFRVSQLEWWARLGGYVLLVVSVWAGMHVLLLYAPPLLNMLQSGYVAAGGAVWALHSIAGVLLGKSAATSGAKAVPWKDWVSRAAPYMFVLGCLVATSWAVHALTHRLGGEGMPELLSYQVAKGDKVPEFSAYLSYALEINNHARLEKLGYALIAGCAIFFVLAWRLDVNLFSIHHFYRNRLTRCFLGAGRGSKRTPNRFTGFDPCDDMHLNCLQQRPLHLVNTALNLVNGGELAWQDRKAYSFTFSPLACGFEYPPNAAMPGGGYCDTGIYMGGAKLGTAMAASGAAASPNMGYHSAPAVAFLLTVFNVRLGHWCPNPKAETHWINHLTRKSPLMGGEYLLRELFGETDDSSPFVYLSDGGHFENLGVYELIRRRCRYIMVVDAGQDENRTFEDAGNLIRKCAIDFGVTINISLDALRVKEGVSTSCYALGDIEYPPDANYSYGQGDADEQNRGVLLYIKPSLLRELPEDIRQYATDNASFPHQTTADQFFDEAQFESYRHLGKFLMDGVIQNIANSKTPAGKRWRWE